MSDTYDVIIIGGGPGGYVAAIRAAQLGLKVACVEKRGVLGGTCLNVGCIPSKALLQSSHLYEMACHEFAEHGIKGATPTMDVKTMMKRKDKVVHDLTGGIAFLLKKNGVDYVQGVGRVVEAGKVGVKKSPRAKENVLKTRDIIIATGSDVAPLKGVEIDEKNIVSSTGALSLSKVPKSLIVIGAGVIGLEMGSVWRRLGAEVTVVEYLDHILPGMDGEVSKAMQRILQKQGMKFALSTKVINGKTGRKVTLNVEPAAGGKGDSLKGDSLVADVVLLAIGRRPYTDRLGLEEAGVALDEGGFVLVDESFQTNVRGIFAIGDVIGGKMLAHKAEDEGVAVAEIIAGEAVHMDYDSIPGVVYTWPEVAIVGKTEEALKAHNIAYNVGKFPLSANSRARANGDADGFVKILTAQDTDAILGAHIIAPAGGDLMQEIVVGMELGASGEDIARICHAHPGLGEAVKEAALASLGRAIHV